MMTPSRKEVIALENWNKEKHHCFDCGGIVEFKNQRDVDLFTYSGLCSKCRDKVIEDMYSRDYASRIERVINLLDMIYLKLDEIKCRLHSTSS